MVSLEALETAHIKKVIAKANSLEHASQVLGIDPATLYRKRKKMELC
jgi:Bacterial regulatory protein, Fis family.